MSRFYLWESSCFLRSWCLEFFKEVTFDIIWLQDRHAETCARTSDENWGSARWRVSFSSRTLGSAVRLWDLHLPSLVIVTSIMPYVLRPIKCSCKFFWGHFVYSQQGLYLPTFCLLILAENQKNRKHFDAFCRLILNVYDIFWWVIYYSAGGVL